MALVKHGKGKKTRQDDSVEWWDDPNWRIVNTGGHLDWMCLRPSDKAGGLPEMWAPLHGKIYKFDWSKERSNAWQQVDIDRDDLLQQVKALKKEVEWLKSSMWDFEEEAKEPLPQKATDAKKAMKATKGKVMKTTKSTKTMNGKTTKTTKTPKMKAMKTTTPKAMKAMKATKATIKTMKSMKAMKAMKTK